MHPTRLFPTVTFLTVITIFACSAFAIRERATGGNFLRLGGNVTSGTMLASDSALTGVRFSLVQAGIVPDVVQVFDPKGLLSATFPDGIDVTPGIALTMNQTSKRPTFAFTPSFGTTTPTGSFVLFMVDPDAPSRNASRGLQIRHMLATDINAAQTSFSNGSYALSNSSAATSDYIGPGPPAGSGPHRYTLLLYQTPSSTANLQTALASLTSANASRANFNVSAFAASAGLGPPIAANTFTVEMKNGTSVQDDAASPPSSSRAETSSKGADSSLYFGWLSVVALQFVLLAFSGSFFTA